ERVLRSFRLPITGRNHRRQGQCDRASTPSRSADLVQPSVQRPCIVRATWKNGRYTLEPFRRQRNVDAIDTKWSVQRVCNVRATAWRPPPIPPIGLGRPSGLQPTGSQPFQKEGKEDRCRHWPVGAEG